MNCEKCGQPMPEGTTYCENCGTSTASVPEVLQEKKENVLLGIIGAVIGAALGGASISLFSQLGVVAALSGVILAFCTLMGYNLLGKKLSVFGIVFCVILMLVTPYVADRLDWAIVVVQAWGDIGLLEAFQTIPELIEEQIIDKTDYIYALGKLYVFVAIGGVGTFVSHAKKKKAK